MADGAVGNSVKVEEIGIGENIFYRKKPSVDFGNNTQHRG
jgi:hypothetical protein